MSKPRWPEWSPNPKCSTGFCFRFSASYVPVFRIFGYITFRTALASLTALAIGLLCGPWLINKLRELSFGQHIREEGPQSHRKKAGTPTMGGLLIVASIVVPTLLWADLKTPTSGSLC